MAFLANPPLPQNMAHLLLHRWTGSVLLELEPRTFGDIVVWGEMVEGFTKRFAQVGRGSAPRQSIGSLQVGQCLLVGARG